MANPACLPSRAFDNDSDPGMVVSGEKSCQHTVIYYSQTHVGEGLEAVRNERLATVAVDLGPSGGKSSEDYAVIWSTWVASL